MNPLVIVCITVLLAVVATTLLVLRARRARRL